MTAEQLDMSDLDAEDLKALNEVSKKGYYHNRPKNEEGTSAPQRIEISDGQETVRDCVPVKRAEFDDFQKKWDRIDVEEDPTEASRNQSSATRIHAAVPPSADESVVAQLMSMGFGEAECRAAAIATKNRADAAVDFLISGGASSRAPQVAAPTQPDSSSIDLLKEMGFSEKHARAALVACKNDLDRAVEHAAKLASDESSTKLQSARTALTQLESDVASLEADTSEAPKAKRLRLLEESLTQASCTLDNLDVDGGVASRAERRAELDRCNALDARLTCLRNRINSAEDVTSSSIAPDANISNTEAPSEDHAAVDFNTRASDNATSIGLENSEVNVAQQRIAEAERLRSEGNTAFKAEDYAAAVQHYLAALSLDSENVAILSNLALAELKLGEFEGAVVHATAANDLSGGFSAKALFRKAQALEGLTRLTEACEAYESALTIEPGDKLVRQRLQTCRKAVEDSTQAQTAGT